MRIEPHDKNLVLRNAFSQGLLFPAPLDKGNVDSGNEIDLENVQGHKGQNFIDVHLILLVHMLVI